MAARLTTRAAPKMWIISGRVPAASPRAITSKVSGACSTKLPWARIAWARAGAPPSPLGTLARPRLKMTLPVSAAPSRPRTAA